MSPADRPGRAAPAARGAAVVLPSLLAVAAVAAVVAALLAANGRPVLRLDALPAPAFPSASPADRTAGPAPTAAGTPTPAAPASTPGPSSPAPPGQGPSAGPAPRPVPQVPVVVFNQTTRQGLAAAVAARLRAAGWQVQGVGTFRGVVPATTVYYPDGQAAAAAALAAALPGPDRTRPRFPGLSTTALTVVLTSDFPSDFPGDSPAGPPGGG